MDDGNNSGNYNSGYRNSGNGNSGDWNSGDRNSGSFNTGTPKYYELFNKPIKAQDYESIMWPDWFHFELKDDYKKSWKESFEGASKEGIEEAIGLPNFDYEVFEKITGITKRMITYKLK